MAKRDDFDDFFGDDETAPTVDTRADGRLYRVPLGRLSPNQVNPRTEFGTEDDLIDFGKSLARRQNQPCPVVSRGAYLKLWPDHAGKMGDVDYVLVSGERRYRAATTVGLPVLDCVANDDFAADRKTFMEAVVSENVDRQNFDPVEEAYAVQALVAEFGSNRAVAQHFERVDGWVTQRLLLTHLAREVQDLVRAKKMPLEAARSLGKLARDKEWPAREQLAWWEEEQQRRTAASAARTAARKAVQQPSAAPEPATSAPSPEPESFTAVKPDPAPTANDPAPHAVADPVPEPPRARQAVPEPRHDDAPTPQPSPSQTAAPPASAPPPRLPYDDGNFIAMHLITKMSSDELVKMLRVLNDHAADNGLTVLPGS